ncbi:MAG TPA: aldehyde dehydrogenase family protein [Kofleriaceae bacterium]|nr:aldehyde dehydrogenase family protein [Kofleriaceae bacterium]
MVPMWMYPIAIACGNTFVLKPSERDPSAASSMSASGSTIMWFLAPPSACTRLPFLVPVS